MKKNKKLTRFICLNLRCSLLSTCEYRYNSCCQLLKELGWIHVIGCLLVTKKNKNILNKIPYLGSKR